MTEYYQCKKCGFTLFRVSIAPNALSEYYQCENTTCSEFGKVISSSQAKSQ